MAMIDYGAIVIKNGKIINENQFFMDMQKEVGWVDYKEVRYSDCDCINEDGYSDCSKCKRSKKEHHKTEEFGEWDSVICDCRGNSIYIENRINGNYFAYVGDIHFTVAVYKYLSIFCVDGKKVFSLWGCRTNNRNNKSIGFIISEIKISIKKLGEGQYLLRFNYLNNHYNIIYGYGIDSYRKIWNKIKYKYIGKKSANKIDRIICTLSN